MYYPLFRILRLICDGVLGRESLDCVDVLVYSVHGTLIAFSIPGTAAREFVGSGVDGVGSTFCGG
jgi:hypothetical protein